MEVDGMLPIRHLLSGGGDDEDEHHVPSVKDIHDDMPGYLYAFNIVGGIFMLGTLCVAGYNMRRHMIKGYEEAKVTVFMPGYRLAILIILFMAPFFGFTSFFAVFGPRSTHLIQLLHNLYEALALAAFFFLIIFLLHGPVDALKAMEEMEPYKLWALPPCCCIAPCIQPGVMNVKTFSFARYAVLQFAILKPVLFICMLGLEYAGEKYDDFSLIFYIINLVQTVLCMYGLFMLYVSSKVQLADFNLTRKFVVIKTAIALGAVQALILTSAVTEGDDLFEAETKAEVINNFLLTIEYFFIAVAGLQAFPVDECNGVFKEALAKGVFATLEEKELTPMVL